MTFGVSVDFQCPFFRCGWIVQHRFRVGVEGSGSSVKGVEFRA